MEDGLTAILEGVIDKIDTLWSDVEKERNGERDDLRRKQCS